MALGRLWAGRAFGTNTGNVFVKLDGDDNALSGALHFNEPGIGLVVYSVKGSFDGQKLSLTGDTKMHVDGVVFGDLTVTATLNSKAELVGEWNTSIGSAGTFILFPHDQAQTVEATSGKLPDQLHTVRYHCGAVEVDREQITAIADQMQREFKAAQVVVTVVTDTEQSRFLPDFKNIAFGSSRASVIKLFAQEPEGNGVNRVIQVEFGPQINVVMTQSGDEAWALGMLEKLKRSVRPLERSYATNIKKLGFGINQILLLAAIVFLPSLGSLRDRAILMAGILGLLFGITWLHARYLPFAAIYLGKKPKGILSRFAPSLISWVIAATAGLAAALLASYLQGLFG